MPNRILPGRALCAASLLVALVFSSASPAAARRGPKAENEQNRAPDVVDELPQALGLMAPFACGTVWQGSTYAGHGTNDWNLDLNRADGAGVTDLGQPILAQADGVVVWFKQSGYNNHAGTYVEIDYGDVTARYIHLVENSIPESLARIGATVTVGETIGLLGATGRVSGPHLHLEYWDSSGYDDTAWYQLPRENHLPVAFAGQVMVAAPGRPSPAIVSTNCPEPTPQERFLQLRLERQRRLDIA